MTRYVFRLGAVLTSSTIMSCASGGTGRATQNEAPLHVVPFTAEDTSGKVRERLAGIAEVRSDRIDVAVTEAMLSPDSPNTHLLLVRAILVKGDPEHSWDIAARSAPVPAAKLRALAAHPGDTVRFTIPNTSNEPLAERRLSFYIEGEVTIPGRGLVPATRPINGPPGLLARPE
jgi:hypothetical protein